MVQIIYRDSRYFQTRRPQVRIRISALGKQDHQVRQTALLTASYKLLQVPLTWW